MWNVYSLYYIALNWGWQDFGSTIHGLQGEMWFINSMTISPTFALFPPGIYPRLLFFLTNTWHRPCYYFSFPPSRLINLVLSHWSCKTSNAQLNWHRRHEKLIKLPQLSSNKILPIWYQLTGMVLPMSRTAYWIIDQQSIQKPTLWS